MLNVLYYCPVFYPQNSGYSNAFLALIDAVLDNCDDINITVLTPQAIGNAPELKRSRLTVIRLSPTLNIKKIRYFANSYGYARFISHYFRENGSDVLFVETFEDALLLSLLDKEILKRTVVRIHATAETEYTFFDDSIIHLIRRFIIERFLSKKILHFASTNQFHLDFVKKWYLHNNQILAGEKNFFVIGNPVSSKRFADYLDVKRPLKAVLLGRMDRLGFNQKGFSDFIQAIHLLDKTTLEAFHFTIIGNGEMMPAVKKATKGLENIQLLESLDHHAVLDLLALSDLVILPSRYEGLSMFALEGLATGNAVIFSRTGGLIDLVDNNGLLFEPQSIEGLSECLSLFANKDDAEIRAMKEQSLHIARNRYSPEIIANKFRCVVSLVARSY